MSYLRALSTLDSFQILYKIPLRTALRNVANSSANVSEEEIVIPKRIHRGPTDILQALSSTVGRDLTAAHYKFHDDPYLIPMSNIGKRTFAMAQESGRKAAKWIRENNSQWFGHRVAEPTIEAYLPKMVFDENSEVEEKDLKELIENVEVSDAIFVYNLMKNKSLAVSEELKLDLLQLICYYNHEDTIDEDWIEERWFHESAKGKERQRKTWKDGDLAEQIFNELEEKNSVAYCAIIRGMNKYNQVEKAYALYQEAHDKGIKLDTDTYNSLLAVCNYLKENADLRWELVLEVLSTMKAQNVVPNLGTLNSILQTISTMGAYRSARTHALRTLAEFKRLQIEPSLGSWYYILIIFCKERGPVSHVLVDIMNEIQDKEFEIQDLKDLFFFTTAMDICRNHLGDKNLAKRVDKLLHHGNNYNLIGDSYKESVYYRHYLSLLCNTESIDIFMETYRKIVPNIYTPEPGVMFEILKTVDANGAIEYVPELWSHLVIFDFVNRENLLSQILKTMIDNPPNTEVSGQENLVTKFSDIAWDMYGKLEEQSEFRAQQFRWSGHVLGNILLLLSRGGEYEKASAVFERIDKNENELIGEPVPSALEQYSLLCISTKQPTNAISCLQYCIENGYPEGKQIGEKILESMTLNVAQAAKVNRLLGKTVPT